MTGTSVRGEAGGIEADGRTPGAQREVPADETALAALGEDELVVLNVLAAYPTGVTLGQLRSRSGLEETSLHSALDGLLAKGLVVRLNTVVESYRPRFPGVRVS